MNDMPYVPIDILLVEDNPGDARLTMEALKDGRLVNRIRHAKHADELFSMLEGVRDQNEAPFNPDLILLDLNLPGRSGLEVLDDLKANPKYRSIPIVMLSTSSAEADIYRSYRSYANCYVTKPVEFAKFLEVVRQIEDFWLTIAKIPRTASIGA